MHVAGHLHVRVHVCISSCSTKSTKQKIIRVLAIITQSWHVTTHPHTLRQPPTSKTEVPEGRCLLSVVVFFIWLRQMMSRPAPDSFSHDGFQNSPIPPQVDQTTAFRPLVFVFLWWDPSIGRVQYSQLMSPTGLEIRIRDEKSTYCLLVSMGWNSSSCQQPPKRLMSSLSFNAWKLTHTGMSSGTGIYEHLLGF